jgi:hypothetical protein
MTKVLATEKNDRVTHTISELGLEACADNFFKNVRFLFMSVFRLWQ